MHARIECVVFACDIEVILRVACSFHSCSCESATEAGAAAAIPTTLPESAAEDDDD